MLVRVQCLELEPPLVRSQIQRLPPQVQEQLACRNPVKSLFVPNEMHQSVRQDKCSHVAHVIRAVLGRVLGIEHPKHLISLFEWQRRDASLSFLFLAVLKLRRPEKRCTQEKQSRHAYMSTKKMWAQKNCICRSWLEFPCTQTGTSLASRYVHSRKY